MNMSFGASSRPSAAAALFIDSPRALKKGLAPESIALSLMDLTCSMHEDHQSGRNDCTLRSRWFRSAFPLALTASHID